MARFTAVILMMALCPALATPEEGAAMPDPDAMQTLIDAEATAMDAQMTASTEHKTAALTNEKEAKQASAAKAAHMVAAAERTDSNSAEEMAVAAETGCTDAETAKTTEDEAVTAAETTRTEARIASQEAGKSMAVAQAEFDNSASIYAQRKTELATVDGRLASAKSALDTKLDDVSRATIALARANALAKRAQSKVIAKEGRFDESKAADDLSKDALAAGNTALSGEGGLQGVVAEKSEAYATAASEGKTATADRRQLKGTYDDQNAEAAQATSETAGLKQKAEDAATQATTMATEAKAKADAIGGAGL